MMGIPIPIRQHLLVNSGPDLFATISTVVFYWILCYIVPLVRMTLVFSNICELCNSNKVQWSGFRVSQKWWHGRISLLVQLSITSSSDNTDDVHLIIRGKMHMINSHPPGKNGHHFADNIFRCIFMNKEFCILIRITLEIVPKSPIDGNPALLQIMAWHHTGDKALSEPMLTWFTDAYMQP